MFYIEVTRSCDRELAQILGAPLPSAVPKIAFTEILNKISQNYDLKRAGKVNLSSSDDENDVNSS